MPSITFNCPVPYEWEMAYEGKIYPVVNLLNKYGQHIHKIGTATSAILYQGPARWCALALEPGDDIRPRGGFQDIERELFTRPIHHKISQINCYSSGIEAAMVRATYKRVRDENGRIRNFEKDD